MNHFIVSDLHFGHKNIFKFCPNTRAKYNNDIDFMTEEMIREWNEIAKSDEDVIYILGDVSFFPNYKTVQILKRLNGNKILVVGNHDKKALKDLHFMDCFTEIYDYLEITFGKHRIIMFHYPIAEWNGAHRGTIHFHGHLHGSVSGLERYRVRDVGFDATGKILWPLEDAIESALTGEQFKGHHAG